MTVQLNTKPTLPPKPLNVSGAHQGQNGHGLPLPTEIIEPTRRADVDARQNELAKILAHAGCDWCLVFEPANIRWLTAGMNVGEWYPPAEQPVLFHNLINRSVVCSALDTQAIFDQELDELGFSVKEYPWHVEREAHFKQLIQNRRVASDRSFGTCIDISDALKKARRTLSPLEQGQYQQLGRLLAHAIEATGRNIRSGETETEISGQLAHRLLKHGVSPVALNILADERADHHTRGIPTNLAVQKRCVIHAVAAKAGLFVSASRTVCFGTPDDYFKETYDQACRLQSILRAKAKVGESVRVALRVGQAYLMETAYEHEWRRSSFGCRIGRDPMEGRLSHLGTEKDLFLSGQPIAWETVLGSVRVIETVLPHSDREEAITGPQEWPTRRVRLAEFQFSFPDYLVIQ